MDNTLLTPILSIVSNFDASKPYTFNYTFLGVDRIAKNELSIRIAEKNSVSIYSDVSNRFDKTHILRENILANGQSYYAKIRVFVDDRWTNWSPEVLFTCFSEPNFIFESLRDNRFVYNDDVQMFISFQQAQGDKVKDYSFVLLDNSKVPLKKYPTRKPLLTSPNVMQERVKGLERGRLYYIGVYVNTINGLRHFYTHEFVPHFVAPSLGGKIEAINNSEHGTMLIQTYLNQNLGIQTKPQGSNDVFLEPYEYTYLGDDWIIIPRDKPLQYTRLGMAEASDFIGKVWCKSIPNGVFLEMERRNGDGIGLKFIKRNDCIICEKEYLNEYGDGIVTRYRSNKVSYIGAGSFYLFIKVVEFRVDLKIELVR